MSEPQAQSLALASRTVVMGLEAHLISLATYPQLALDQGAQGELAQVPDPRSGQMGGEVQ